MKRGERRVAKLYDDFALQGYRTLSEQVNHYAIPELLPELLRQRGITTRGMSVLDLGCGPGNLADFLSFKEYTGVDLSSQMLREAGESGYSELIEASMVEYANNPLARPADCVVALSCAYFVDPLEIRDFIRNMDRLAAKCWIATLDGITPAIQEIYQEGGVETYDYIGLSLPWQDLSRSIVRGWDSVRTNEQVPMEIVIRVKP